MKFLRFCICLPISMRFYQILSNQFRGAVDVHTERQIVDSMYYVICRLCMFFRIPEHIIREHNWSYPFWVQGRHAPQIHIWLWIWLEKVKRQHRQNGDWKQIWFIKLVVNKQINNSAEEKTNIGCGRSAEISKATN